MPVAWWANFVHLAVISLFHPEVVTSDPVELCLQASYDHLGPVTTSLQDSFFIFLIGHVHAVYLLVSSFPPVA